MACDERHEAELFAGPTLYSSSTVVAYPGVEPLRALGAATCRFYFDSALVVGADKSRLEVVALVPSEATFQLDSSTVPAATRSAAAPCTACCGRPTAASWRAPGSPSNRADSRPRR